MLNWGHEPHTGDDSRFALIDLLTDEPMDAQQDNDRTCPIDDGTSPIAGEDSREKLEADVYRAADEMEKFTYGERFINTHKILRWLDRQAEITKRECDRPNWEYCDTCETLATLRGVARQFRDERDKAEARVAELEAAISALKELLLEVPVDSIAASKLEGGL
jgi:hypothetical protein